MFVETESGIINKISFDVAQSGKWLFEWGYLLALNTLRAQQGTVAWSGFEDYLRSFL